MLEFIKKLFDNYYHYTNSMLVSDVNKIARQVEDDHFKPDYIVGLARGGWPLAFRLSHKLKIDQRNLISVTWGRRYKVRSEELEAAYLAGKRIILAEDITDTGKSISELAAVLAKLKPENMKNIRLASLVNYVGDGMIYLHTYHDEPLRCNYYGRSQKETKGKWVKYAWEAL